MPHQILTPEQRSLAAEQSRDDRRIPLRQSRRMVRATDLGAEDEGWAVLDAAEAGGLEPWQIAAIREQFGSDHPNAQILVGFTPTWTAEFVHYDPASGQSCPACGSVPLVAPSRGPLIAGAPNTHVIGRTTACVECHITPRAPHMWPMQTARAIAEIMKQPLRRRVRALIGGTGHMPGRPEIRPKPIERENPEDN